MMAPTPRMMNQRLAALRTHTHTHPSWPLITACGLIALLLGRFCVCRNNKQKIMHSLRGLLPLPLQGQSKWFTRIPSSVRLICVTCGSCSCDGRSFKHFCIIYAILISKSSARVIIIAEMDRDSDGGSREGGRICTFAFYITFPKIISEVARKFALRSVTPTAVPQLASVTSLHSILRHRPSLCRCHRHGWLTVFAIVSQPVPQSPGRPPPKTPSPTHPIQSFSPCL